MTLKELQAHLLKVTEIQDLASMSGGHFGSWGILCRQNMLSYEAYLLSYILYKSCALPLNKMRSAWI